MSWVTATAGGLASSAFGATLAGATAIAFAGSQTECLLASAAGAALGSIVGWVAFQSDLLGVRPSPSDTSGAPH